MPKLPIDYSKSCIYVIRCKNETITEEYIGSTTNFNKRKNKHKSNCCNEKDKEYNILKNVFIRENGGWDNWDMIMIEEYSCENKRQLEMKEEQIRVERNSKLNSQSCYMEKSNYQRNLELHPNYIKEQYEKQLKLNPNICKEHYQRQLELHPNINKEQYEKRIKLNPNYCKEQYEKYKEIFLKKRREKYTCETCGEELTLGSKWRHNKQKHSS